MIDIRELRVGNWVEAKHSWETGVREQIEVENIYNEFVNYSHFDGDSTYRTGIKPIPLTPEILEKCGFKPKLLTGRFDYYTIDGRYEVVHHKADDSFKCNRLPYGHRGFKNLHQLQNFHFCMIEEELNYQP